MVFSEEQYKEASDLARTMSLEDIDFNLFDTHYSLGMCPKYNPETGKLNGVAAEYFFQRTEDMWEIYIWEGLQEKIQRPLLFHEIVEIFHRTKGMNQTSAHNATMKWEERFCKESLSNTELKEYLKFKKESGYNGFDLIAK